MSPRPNAITKGRASKVYRIRRDVLAADPHALTTPHPEVLA